MGVHFNIVKTKTQPIRLNLSSAQLATGSLTAVPYLALVKINLEVATAKQTPKPSGRSAE